ncbi:hypothetical protein VOLCADRAFT_87703 [Volvox carteri f. nagariensis]|uniref:Uncharacterized protein n=1 Tax=Volvox carteri f. nagariensis TaxID=3068 RepID=D8TM13_VOLCA|nr:uncharacterized protein VOLCADRAFT_87703 [Volvox carteri f. nagariensis]EFJ51559.1 hypothetical protein VOLCADRAFT_87703 [Volvox carteri f. nagariensis]|eukprot:XP_002947511.1 hypothetical protein VOLCADRAFT_87703 [Volvox carteri f. nagariensis]
MNIHLRKDGTHVLWWHQKLLQLFDILAFATRHMSAEQFCARLVANWEQNGCCKPDSVFLSSLRKRFRQALVAYHYLQGLVDDFPKSLPGGPSGALNGCSCCGDAVCNQCRRAATVEADDGAAGGSGGEQLPPPETSK